MSDHTLTFYDLEFHYSSGRDEVITFMAGRGSFEIDEHEYRVTRLTDDGEATITVQRDKLDSYGVTKRVEKAFLTPEEAAQKYGYTEAELQAQWQTARAQLDAREPKASEAFWRGVPR